MTPDQLQHFDELILKAVQSGKKETSGLVSDIKDHHREIKEGIAGITKRLDTLNGSVAKHADKLAMNDILNTQVTMTQTQIVTDLATLKKKEEETSAFRLKSEGSINTFKWLFGFVGFGSLLTLLKVWGIIG